MLAIESENLNPPSLFRRQAYVCAAFGLLLSIIVGSLYYQARQREWMLRREQAKHRLDVAFELISREVDRVRADVLFLADQTSVRQYMDGDASRLEEVKMQFAQFVDRKQTYDQIRLLNLNGLETIRVNYARGRIVFVDESELQDKSDRYYFQESLTLDQDEVFVSEFDLNLEHGQIEKPLKPVIRFVASVVNDEGQVEGFLVLNYLGGRLLRTLDDSTLPGMTMLLRPDGHYLRSPNAADSWGWLLGHKTTFRSHFPEVWSRIDEMKECQLTAHGAFATKRIRLGKNSRPDRASERADAHGTFAKHANDSIIVVSYLPRDRIFASSNELLRRLLALAVCVFFPIALFARYWARATLAEQLQARKIAESEEQLRDLSARLLRIQEDERRAISREIHDEFGQQVTAINLDLKLAARNIESQQARPHLERAIGENETLLQSLHEFATRVRPAVLDDLGLRDAVESHLSEFHRRTGIEVDAHLRFPAEDIPDEVADHAYRLLQESLNNVVKHADATKVCVEMSIDHAGGPRFLLSVKDNGRGYADHNQGRGLGLIGMRERVDLLSGQFNMQSRGEEGTSIEIWLPLDGAQSAEPSI